MRRSNKAVAAIEAPDVVCVRKPSGAVFFESAKDRDVLEFIDARLNAFDKGPLEIGDACVFLNARHGEKYLQILSVLCRKRSDWESWYCYLRNCKYVASNVRLSDRSDKLGFRHHYEVAKLGRPDQRKFLALAEKNEWTVSELRVAIRGEEREVPKLAWKPQFEPSAWAADGLRWFNRQFEESPLETWDVERRSLLKRDLEPLVRIYNQL